MSTPRRAVGRPVRLVYYDDQSNPSTRSTSSSAGMALTGCSAEGAQSRGMVTGRAGLYPLCRFWQKTDCESAHGEHVDWESAERILLQRKYISGERGASRLVRLELRAISLYMDHRVGGFLHAGQPVHRPLENGHCVASLAYGHCFHISSFRFALSSWMKSRRSQRLSKRSMTL